MAINAVGVMIGNIASTGNPFIAEDRARQQLQLQQQQQQNEWTLVQQENQQLKQSLARMQSEYEELQDDSNYHKAKVTELSDILAHKVRSVNSSSSKAVAPSTPSTSSSSSPQPHHHQHHDKSVGDVLHDSLIVKSQQNAELTLKVAKLQSQIKERDVQIEDLNRERQANKRLLLEMSDIVRTLQSVHISYDTTSIKETDTTYLGSQQVAIKKIKMKVEAIMSDRTLLVRRCRELEQETAEQKEKIKALEVQFHLLNSINLATGGGGLATMTAAHNHQAGYVDNGQGIHMTISPANTANITRSSFSISTKASTPMSPLYNCRHPNDDHDDDDASMVDGSMNSCMTQSRLLREQQKAHQEQQEALQQEHEKQVGQLHAENNRVYEKMDSLEEELRKTKEDMEDAIIKRDEYRENLRDIILQYKELHAEHEATTELLMSVQRKVEELEKEIQTKREQDSEIERSIHHAVQEGLVANMEDVIAAYSRSVERIATLEARLETAEREANAACDQKDSGDRKFRDAIARSQRMEHERNQFQILLDKAREDTRKAKLEAQKEREEAKHVRRRLTAYMQKKEGSRSPSPRRTTPTARHQLSIPDLKRNDEVTGSTAASSVSATDGRWMQDRDALISETQRLVRENQELKTICEELLSEVAATDSKPRQD